MRPRTRWYPPLLLTAIVACADGLSSVEPRGVAVGASLAATSVGCYTPKFNVRLVPSGPLSFTGQVTGDLQGTASFVFDPGSFTFSGVTFRNSGTAHWEITGGIVPGLGTFDTEFKNLNLLIDRPGSPASVFENKGTHQALSGVSKANLTFIGTFTASPAPHTDHDYQGVICL